MIESLQSLISTAKDLASGDDWVQDGGRACFLGWEDCSQPVFRSRNEKYWDYGEPGGPGYAHCERSCKHSMKEPEDE